MLLYGNSENCEHLPEDVTDEEKTYIDDYLQNIIINLKRAIENKSITVDSALRTTSENPVQNKVINTALGNYLPLKGGTMTGAINMNGKDINNVRNITNVEGQNLKINVVEGKLEIEVENGIDFYGGDITNVTTLGLLQDPTDSLHAATKRYVDDKITEYAYKYIDNDVFVDLIFTCVNVTSYSITFLDITGEGESQRYTPNIEIEYNTFITILNTIGTVTTSTGLSFTSDDLNKYTLSSETDTSYDVIEATDTNSPTFNVLVYDSKIISLVITVPTYTETDDGTETTYSYSVSVGNEIIFSENQYQKKSIAYTYPQDTNNDCWEYDNGDAIIPLTIDNFDLNNYGDCKIATVTFDLGCMVSFVSGIINNLDDYITGNYYINVNDTYKYLFVGMTNDIVKNYYNNYSQQYMSVMVLLTANTYKSDTDVYLAQLLNNWQ